MVGDGGFRARILVFVVNHHGIVRLGPHAVVTPALPARACHKAWIVRTKVQRPAHAAGIQNERAQVEMPVIRLVVAALYRQENSLRVIPRAAEKRYLCAVKYSFERPVL